MKQLNWMVQPDGRFTKIGLPLPPMIVYTALTTFMAPWVDLSSGIILNFR